MLEIWEDEVKEFDERIAQNKPNLTPYLIKKKCINTSNNCLPRGAYTHKAKHEGEPIAEWLNTIGINAFVL